MTTPTRARTVTTAQRALRTLLIAPLLVVMAASLSACGKTAEETALQNCLDATKVYVQSHPDEFDTVEKVAAAADLCNDMPKVELVEIYG